MILFIDDEPARIKSFVEYLKDENFDTKIISSLDEADKFLKNNFQNIDLIVLDIMMPSQSFFDPDSDAVGVNGGFSLYKKTRDGHKEIPIIIFTNKVNIQDIQNMISKDKFSYFIHKRKTLPFELANKISEIIDSTKKIIQLHKKYESF
jgi:CheY-like chemotaxis protein